MKSMWPPLAAIFFMTYLYRAGGAMAPSAPPWIRYWYLRNRGWRTYLVKRRRRDRRLGGGAVVSTSMNRFSPWQKKLDRVTVSPAGLYEPLVSILRTQNSWMGLKWCYKRKVVVHLCLIRKERKNWSNINQERREVGVSLLFLQFLTFLIILLSHSLA